MHACIQIQALHQNFKMETNQSITQLHRSILWWTKKKSHLITDQSPPVRLSLSAGLSARIYSIFLSQQNSFNRLIDFNISRTSWGRTKQREVKSLQLLVCIHVLILVNNVVADGLCSRVLCSELKVHTHTPYLKTQVRAIFESSPWTRAPWVGRGSGRSTRRAAASMGTADRIKARMHSHDATQPEHLRTRYVLDARHKQAAAHRTLHTAHCTALCLELDATHRLQRFFPFGSGIASLIPPHGRPNLFSFSFWMESPPEPNGTQLVRRRERE